VALVVEDGTGKADANAFVSVAVADARHTLLGNTAWTGDDATKEAAIARATAYMEQAYRTRWVGCRAHQDQALSWPRYINELVSDQYIASDIVPTEIANACADLALKALADDLNPDLTRGVKRKKIGPLETEYDDYSPQSVRRRAVDMALAPFLKGSSAMATLVRA
jgi:hypothetical protein